MTHISPAADLTWLDLRGARIVQTLERNGITTVGDLASCSERYLLSRKGIGNTYVKQIRDALSTAGYPDLPHVRCPSCGEAIP